MTGTEIIDLWHGFAGHGATETPVERAEIVTLSRYGSPPPTPKSSYLECSYVRANVVTTRWVTFAALAGHATAELERLGYELTTAQAAR